MNTPPLSPVPASRNRWDLCDVSVDLDSLQATGVWGGVGERYSLKEGPTELSKASLWGPELAQPGKEPQVSAPCRRPPPRLSPLGLLLASPVLRVLRALPPWRLRCPPHTVWQARCRDRTLWRAVSASRGWGAGPQHGQGEARGRLRRGPTRQAGLVSLRGHLVTPSHIPGRPRPGAHTDRAGCLFLTDLDGGF